MVYTLLSGAMVYTLFPCFSQGNGIHHSFFCSVTSGSGDRPRKEGCHGGGVCSVFPGKAAKIAAATTENRAISCIQMLTNTIR